jgi:diadenylate cyclase
MEQLGDLGTYLRALEPVDLVDIALVAGIFYAALFLVRGTRAVQLIRGVLVVALGTFLLSGVASLRGFHWLLEIILPALFVAIPVIFQPELRRALEQLGRAGVLINRAPSESAASSIVSVVALAARRLSEKRLGALIVLERDTALGDLAERGVRLDAEATVELITQLFVRNSPLHDGAAIIRDGRVAAAGVVLPIGDLRASDLPTGLGTRHLAAVSVTESTDALAVVVSEETAVISLARDGHLARRLDEGELARLLYEHYVARPTRGEWLRPIRGAATAVPQWFRPREQDAEDGEEQPLRAAGSKDTAGAAGRAE